MKNQIPLNTMRNESDLDHCFDSLNKIKKKYRFKSKYLGIIQLEEPKESISAI